MNRHKAARGTLQKGLPKGPDLGRMAMIARQVAIQSQEERNAARKERDLANTYLAAVLVEYGAAKDGILISKKTMQEMQGKTFSIEKASDEAGLSLRVVLSSKVVEAEEVLDATPEDKLFAIGSGD